MTSSDEDASQVNRRVRRRLAINENSLLIQLTGQVPNLELSNRTTTRQQYNQEYYLRHRRASPRPRGRPRGSRTRTRSGSVNRSERGRERRAQGVRETPRRRATETEARGERAAETEARSERAVETEARGERAAETESRGGRAAEIGPREERADETQRRNRPPELRPRDSILHVADYTRPATNTRRNDELHLGWETVRSTFEKKIREGPIVICYCCGGLFFKKSISTVRKEKMAEDWQCTTNVIESAFWAITSGHISIAETDPINHMQSTEKGHFCFTCKDSLKKNKIPTLALTCGLAFPRKENYLEELTRLEERMVSARHIFQSIWTLQGNRGQYRSRGGIVNAPVNVDTTVQVLPRPLTDSHIIHVSLARKLEYRKDYIKGNVSPLKIWRAAEHLQQMPLYQDYDITLDTEWMRVITNEIEQFNTDVNGNNYASNSSINFANIANTETSDINASDTNPVDETTGTAPNFAPPVQPDVQPVNPGGQETIIINDNEQIRLAPAEGNRPLSILVDKDTDFLAFPKIYVVQRFDRRVAERIDCILFMDRKYQLLKLRSNMNTVLRKKTNTGDIDGQSRPYTAADVSDHSRVNQLLSKDQAYRTFQGIRSSSEYWKNEKKNVLAMIRQFGIPTLFITVSAAESKWNEFLCMLKKVVDNEGTLPTEEQMESLSYEEKARLIQSDPSTCAQYFDHRFRELKKTWLSSYGPFNGFEMIEYFFRVEFQHRGSPHIHMLVWLDDAPTYDANASGLDNEVEVCRFIDNLISCSRDWDGSIHTQNVAESSEDTWTELMRRQTHRHSRSCQRKRGNNWICRFNIPFFPMQDTRILRPYDDEDDAANENIRLAPSSMTFSGFLNAAGITSIDDYILALRTTIKRPKLFIKRLPNAIVINNYSSKIISTMKSNMDIQFILDPYACCSYIADYINKADRGMSEALNEVYTKCREDNNSTAFDMLKSLSSVYYNASEISAQEAVYNLLGLRMVASSTTTVFIPTSKPEERMHILKNQFELLRLPSDSLDIFMPGMVEHYMNRPDSLEAINLAQFAAYYAYSKSQPPQNSSFVNPEDPEGIMSEIDDEMNDTNAPIDAALVQDGLDNSRNVDGGRPGQVFRLKNNDGFIKRRKKSKIIRYYKFDVENTPEDYFRTLLMLYHPWRNEQNELIDVDCIDKFNGLRDSVMESKLEFCKLDDNALDDYLESLLNERMMDEDAAEDDEGLDTNPHGFENYDRENDFNRYTLDVDDSDQGDHHRTVNMDEELNLASANHGTGTGATYAEKILLPSRLTNECYYQLLALLNAKQRSYLYHIMNHIRYNKEMTVHPMFSNSTVSQSTFKPFYHFVTGGAGTGKSLLIKALHECLARHFDIGRERDMSTPSVLLCAPTGKAAFNISGQTIHNAFTIPVEQFGYTRGLSALSASVSHSMAVTLKDLQVVIIDEISMVGQVLLEKIDKRLRDMFCTTMPFGGKSLIVLGDLLQIPPVMATTLFSRTIANPNGFAALFNQQIWSLFSVHKLSQIMRQRDDAAFAQALNNMAKGEDATSTSFDRVTGRSGNTHAIETLYASVANNESAESIKNMNLLRQLHLKVAGYYMLVVNLNTADGLVNGATGHLRKIDYGSNNGIRKPLRVWVEFDDEATGKVLRQSQRALRRSSNVPDMWTMIERITSLIAKDTRNHLQLYRTQFPMVPAEAITVHKSQGSTYTNVLVNQFKTKLHRSMLYVACSRATSAAGLTLIYPDNRFKPTAPLDITSDLAIEIASQPERYIALYFTALSERHENERFTQIISHNIQSLRAHINQVVNDQTYLLSDILLFSETWTLPNGESYQIPGFTLASRIDGPLDVGPSAVGSCCFVSNRLASQISATSSRMFVRQNSSVSISTVTVLDTLYCSIYASPNALIHLILEALTFAVSSTDVQFYVIAGDFNVRFDRYTEYRTQMIIQFLRAKNIRSSLPADIESTTKDSTFIDNIFTNRPPRSSGRYLSLTSTHEPLWLVI
ncbi:hypothetical protein [Parasitella parasitica]|uniref:ATP-dependent DNA helicase n=1 Tax=Parasitella parasitica TaxID=35722 RepID=A0A0B7NNE4_9FUNG|nr:hypothetical protein [Parasitella parasitica]